ncbi:MAG: hypothetical protein VXZ18_18910 [Pseudomonadota bacterium]|nr:hypothetical protein [Pseudomonadota bacterium]
MQRHVLGALEVLYYIIFGVIVVYVIWDVRRKNKRRESLRRRDDGTYVWTDFDGTERTSRTHPDEKGGEWYVEGSSDDGGGDGGD